MNWRYKAATQMLLSHAPSGHYINYLFARHVTHHLPENHALFVRDVSFAKSYVDVFREHGAKSIEEAVFYEFGVGWDLLYPMTLYTLGANRQYVVDIARLLRPNLVAQTAARLAREANLESVGRSLHKLTTQYLLEQLIDLLNERFGIIYKAPFNSMDTGWASGSVDYITSSKVLGSVPEEQLLPLMRECLRVLAPDGLIAFVIDYRDQYSYSDSSLSVYNFLQFSEREWRRYNPAIHYQNRLRHPDYCKLFEKAGFSMIKAERGLPDATSLNRLRSMRIDPHFSSHTLEDLAVVRGEFLLKKTSQTAYAHGSLNGFVKT
jgi:SAM-dependent methyltransferase